MTLEIPKNVVFLVGQRGSGRTQYLSDFYDNRRNAVYWENSSAYMLEKLRGTSGRIVLVDDLLDTVPMMRDVVSVAICYPFVQFLVAILDSEYKKLILE